MRLPAPSMSRREIRARGRTPEEGGEASMAASKRQKNFLSRPSAMIFRRIIALPDHQL